MMMVQSLINILRGCEKNMSSQRNDKTWQVVQHNKPIHGDRGMQVNIVQVQIVKGRMITIKTQWQQQVLEKMFNNEQVEATIQRRITLMFTKSMLEICAASW